MTQEARSLFRVCTVVWVCKRKTCTHTAQDGSGWSQRIFPTPPLWAQRNRPQLGGGPVSEPLGVSTQSPTLHLFQASSHPLGTPFWGWLWFLHPVWPLCWEKSATRPFLLPGTRPSCHGISLLPAKMTEGANINEAALTVSFYRAVSWQERGLSKDCLGGSHAPAYIWPRFHGKARKSLLSQVVEGRGEDREGDVIKEGGKNGGDHSIAQRLRSNSQPRQPDFQVLLSCNCDLQKVN